ncbi:FAD binding domain-containing protein [Coprinopsis marcescibilis]|uniref:FAD binding domain-containing protein n=1 Tax=Coprinopsis marcescibilis TaxID=230819 RepID=A0A5C3KIS4_COPMA|nr:FAD binding domain-containing protein [Coprinopsis marcescibilis]
MRFLFVVQLVLGYILSRVAAQNPFLWNGIRYSCKCYDGDSCFPNASLWSALNATVEGNLQRVIPDPAVCYNTFEGINTYNQAACSEVTRQWSNQQWQSTRAVSAHWILWTNNTCLPTTNRNAQCTIGYLPKYVILAKKREHIKAGIDFARNNNVRLIIRNTGHDFMGRSTGFGSLAINTHSFKDVTFIQNYSGPGGYTGGAVTVGAGIQGRELLTLGNRQNPKVAIVTGECPTVGFAGGYIQGGGHGPLASYYGMAADQALSYEVITADGEYRTVNSESYPDLFWGLKGGGPSTFAALLSVTVKTFPEIPTAGVVMTFNSANADVTWRAFGAFHNLANRWVENGMFVYYEMFGTFFNIRPFVGPNMNAAKINQVLQPLYDQLRSMGIQYTAQVTEYPTFFALYTALFQDEAAGANSVVGGRVFTKQDITQNGNNIVNAVRQAGGGIIGHIVGPGFGAPSVDNAIHPAWRNASSFSITGVSVPNTFTWAQKTAAQNQLTNQVDGPIRAASPYGAAYVNEGNLEEPNWQTAYWGTNYPRLKELKAKWDPQGVFYARTTPGTENWEVIDYGRRLCLKP